LLRRTQADTPRSMKVALVAQGRQFPSTYVSGVFAAHRIAAEPVEFQQGEHAKVRYRARLGLGTSLDDVSAELLGGGSGIASVSWEASKKGL
jgi:hypothetical protein